EITQVFPSGRRPEVAQPGTTLAALVALPQRGTKQLLVLHKPAFVSDHIDVGVHEVPREMLKEAGMILPSDGGFLLPTRKVEARGAPAIAVEGKSYYTTTRRSEKAPIHQLRSRMKLLRRPSASKRFSADDKEATLVQ
ncbi:unnamed protein product, partial [Amoebophrya sp. A120]